MTPFLALALATAAPTVAPDSTLPGLPVDVLPRQSLPGAGCAAYLWASLPNGERRLAAMAGTDPASLRLMLDGQLADLPRVAEDGTAGLGFAGSTTYRAGSITATLSLSVSTRTDLTGGAVVPDATLLIERTGQDAVALPLAGLIGCAPAAAAGN